MAKVQTGLLKHDRKITFQRCAIYVKHSKGCDTLEDKAWVDASSRRTGSKSSLLDGMLLQGRDLIELSFSAFNSKCHIHEVFNNKSMPQT